MKLSQVLKEKTEIAHQQLEKILIGKLKSISSTEDYLEILSGFYGYIKPLEARISEMAPVALLPDYHERRKSDALYADMEHFRPGTGSALCPDTPAIENQFAALGALYVLEGSTLGGQIISRMLIQKLHLEDHKGGLSFFQSYGELTPVMWDRFKAVLDEKVPAEQWSAVVNSAEETFIKFKTWLE